MCHSSLALTGDELLDFDFLTNREERGKMNSYRARLRVRVLKERRSEVERERETKRDMENP